MNCVICNKEIEKSRFTNAILCSSECHKDHFWLEKIELHDELTVVVDHTRYHIAEDSPGAYFKGHGGREFNIEFFDGRKIKSRNLWCQGDVPEKYWKQIPNNAKFI
jgi:hypothetical protein